MARYLISFDDGAMDFIPEEEGPDVAAAAHAVVREAMDAGVWVFAGGVYPHDEVSARVVAPDGTVTDGAESKAYIAGSHDHRRGVTRGGAAVGGQDRRRLPLCARGPRAPSSSSSVAASPSGSRIQRRPRAFNRGTRRTIT